MALKNNGDVRAASLETKANHSLKATAFELPKAEISGQYGHYDGPDKNLAFEISQTLPFPTLFWAKAKELKAGHQLAELQLAAKQNQTRQAVRILIEEIRHMEARLFYQNKLTNAYERCYAIIAERRKLGEGSQQELTMAKVKLRKANYNSENISIALSELYKKLNALCGNIYQGQQVILCLADKKIESRLWDKSISELFLDENLELRSLNAEIDGLKAKKHVSLSEQLPDITLGYQNSSAVGVHTIDGKDFSFDIRDRFNSFSVGLSIPLNIFSSYAKVKATRLQTEAKNEELKQVRRNILVQFNDLFVRYNSEEERLRYYKEDALPEAEQMLKLAEENYKLGDSSYLVYTQALETYNEVMQDYLESSLKLNLCVINLYALCNK